MSAKTLTALIQHSIRTHDAQQFGTGLDGHGLDSLSGTAYGIHMAICDRHGDFAMMLRNIITEGRPAATIIQSLSDLMAELQDSLASMDNFSNNAEERAGRMMATAAFIPELAAIIASEDTAPALDQGDESEGGYDFTDWQSEAAGTADGREGVHYIEIRDPDGEEAAIIVHRTIDGQFPLDGPAAAAKMQLAETIVDALNSER